MTQQYKLGKRRQLIDLNQDSVNFDLTFKVTCHTQDAIFNLLVVDQTTLDNNTELKYKEVKNTISGNITSDKNVYQNYFLILKMPDTHTGEDCDITVELVKKELPVTPEQIMNPNPNQVYNTNPNLVNPKPKMLNDSNVNWTKIILICIVIVIGGGFIWNFYKKKKQTEPNKTGINNDRSIDLSKEKLIERPTERPNERQPERPTERQPERPTERQSLTSPVITPKHTPKNVAKSDFRPNTRFTEKLKADSNSLLNRLKNREANI